MPAGALGDRHRAPRSHSRGVPVMAVVAAATWAVVAAVALGGLLRGESGGDDAASLSRPVRGDGFALTAPPGWSRVRATREVRSAGFERPLVLALDPSLGPRLAVERISPLRTRARPDERARRADPTGSVDAERLASGLTVWRSAAPGGAGGNELFVAPTTGGLLTAACFSARAGACDELVDTLRPVGDAALRLTAGALMQIALPKIAERLAAERRAARARINMRPDAATWGAGATAAAEAFRRAARSIERLAPGSAHGQAAIHALGVAARAYARLAAAGFAWDARRWTRERRAVAAAERRAEAALGAAGG